ncbi:EAL domain-containing protein [Pacificimonas flava]|uniref:Diguanylate cyclase/phosphodiesterase (GGDEF & EAL domains) with PAS/PAC sensor(S) n=1 Tax=Pacificimonas flava TaxID=1234595 RepID=M2TPZ2_9SPHN|nr:EAL domain-containing protein [Pacificimonas flava]EMD83821.1 diguanylate cyclase/phosphodiesterase (GGDEF & EAL domains) with PAS/PAC sensor(s) [Pacificimonas flava]MBB5280497.1 diguanylate cyclase (GGDEF)-like protein [Pacificimonas flava]
MVDVRGILVFTALAVAAMGVPVTSADAQRADAATGQTALRGDMPSRNNVRSAISAARANIAARPEASLALAELAEAETRHWSAGKERQLARLEAQWLRGEALIRLNRAAEARPLLDQALAEVEVAAPDSQLHARLLASRGGAGNAGGHTASALRDLHRAFDLFGADGDSESQAYILRDLGLIYSRAQDYDRALDYFRQARTLSPGNPNLVAASLNGRARAYAALAQYDEAKTAYRDALAAARRLDSPLLEVRLLTELASVQYRTGELSAAQATIDRAWTRGRATTEQDWQPFLWGLRAQIAMARGHAEEAERLILRAFADKKIAETTANWMPYHEAAYLIFERRGDFQSAYRHLAAYNRLQRQTMEAASSAGAALLTARFDAANRKERIDRLESEQLRSGRRLEAAEARFQAMTATGLLGAGGVLVILAALTGAFLAVRRSHREVSAANDLLKRSAERDALTDLPNRQQYQDMMGRALAAAQAGRGTLALFLIDLDRFKEVNDTHGHAGGDRLLCGVARRITSMVSHRDDACRLGGDEFAVIVRSVADRGELAALAQSVIDEIGRSYQLEDSRATVGATIGIAIAPEDGGDIDALTRSADLAMYAAKEAGRGRFRFYEPAMRSAADDRRRLEADLGEALTRGELTLHYQPIVGAATGAVTCYEALVRWRHPKRGLVPPATFIPIAEDAGLIHMIGDWVLRTGCCAAAAWPADVKLAVNLSTLQVENEGLATSVMSALSASGLAADRLELEVTESVFLRDNRRTTAMLARLRAMGVSLALDDFGTGYSSLGYLHRAEFSKIKIDKSFVRAAVAGWDQGVAIIEAIVALAKGLGMETVAEGIETEEDRLRMIELGCTHLQGYLFGRGDERMGGRPVRDARLAAPLRRFPEIARSALLRRPAPPEDAPSGGEGL